MEGKNAVDDLCPDSGRDERGRWQGRAPRAGTGIGGEEAERERWCDDLVKRPIAVWLEDSRQQSWFEPWYLYS